MTKRFIIFGLLFLFSTTVRAQQPGVAMVRGRVLATADLPVVGATITLPKGSVGTNSDSTGAFSLTVPAGSYRLRVSAVGMVPLEKVGTVKAGAVVDLGILRLKPDETQLAEVVVRGKTEAANLAESARAVDIIAVKTAKTRAVDMAEVLASTKGTNVRRSGGLGSDARFSLNGLTDDQVRFFVDGIPLGFTGYSFGFANMPVNLVERVEVYKGVLPIQFGADALGGAVNIVSPTFSEGLHGNVSAQVGSFGTYRLTGATHYANDKTGFYAGINGFYDQARNNYRVNVPIANDRGKEEIITVRRFHDAFEAKGGNVEVGVRNKKWAKLLAVNLFYTDFDKDLQNNNIMVVPYGGVTYGRASRGTYLKYAQDLGKTTTLNLVAGHARSTISFVDTSSNVYNWRGEVVTKRANAGEIGRATDQVLWENGTYARVNLEKRINEAHQVRFSVAPTYITRTGDERRQLNPDGFDPLTGQNKLFYLVNGLEYELNALKNKLQNTVFGKQYNQQLSAIDRVPGLGIVDKSRTTSLWGLGNSMRYKLSDALLAKVSYEWTTRLPTSDEVFGDGALTLANYDLKPERSQNANLELNYSNSPEAGLKWEVSANGFIRQVENQVVLLGTDNLFKYQNVFGATSKGIELATELKAFNRNLVIDGNLTYIDFRNTSTSGPYAKYDGDRIPNRPYFFTNSGVRYRIPNLFNDKYDLSLFWNARYIHSFYRGWESDGLKEYKQVIPTQFIQSGGFSYEIPGKQTLTSLNAEVQNITNGLAFDNFGVQKPGRAYYLKVTFKI